MKMVVQIDGYDVQIMSRGTEEKVFIGYSLKSFIMNYNRLCNCWEFMDKGILPQFKAMEGKISAMIIKRDKVITNSARDNSARR
jgi:hypothetical protein